MSADETRAAVTKGRDVDSNSAASPRPAKGVIFDLGGTLVFNHPEPEDDRERRQCAANARVAADQRGNTISVDIETVSYANMMPALVATWLRGLQPQRGQAPSPGTNPGLEMRVPSRWLNSALKHVTRGEAWYLAKAHRRLPYGHSLISLATGPARGAPEGRPVAAAARHNREQSPLRAEPGD